MTPLAHFYHAYADGAWREPLAEHLWALEESGFDGPFHVGLVGNHSNRLELRAELAAIRPPDHVVEAQVGWEQVTLHALHKYAQTHHGAVLYAHTKGSYTQTRVNEAWRRSMTHHLVRRWPHALQRLKAGVDVVGCHWLTEHEYPQNAGTAPMPCFGGNYWLATTHYLAKLPACQVTCRHDAEAWIGLNHPQVVDLTPGWPGNFTPVKYGRLIAAR